jgi:predicted ATP-grasp superfamily ATP-dependent carboligase
MLSAVMADLTAVPGVEPVALVAEDLSRLPFPHRTVTPSTERRHFRRLAEQCDYSLVIAPEFDNLLEERCCWVLEAGGKLLGPDPEAVALTADKYELSRHFDCHRVPDEPARLANEAKPALPCVYKPRFGAGSLFTSLVRTAREREHLLESLPDMPFVVQRYRRGTAASVSFLVGPGLCLPLLPAGQRITEEAGRLSYAGGWTPLKETLRRRAVRLARQAVQSVPGLRGHVGVDLILASGGRDVVMEINPRLTTSYLGLRRLARVNLAGAMLDVARGRRPKLRWHHDRTVTWTPDGEVRVE